MGIRRKWKRRVEKKIKGHRVGFHKTNPRPVFDWHPVTMMSSSRLCRTPQTHKHTKWISAGIDLWLTVIFSACYLSSPPHNISHSHANIYTWFWFALISCKAAVGFGVKHPSSCPLTSHPQGLMANIWLSHNLNTNGFRCEPNWMTYYALYLSEFCVADDDKHLKKGKAIAWLY